MIGKRFTILLLFMLPFFAMVAQELSEYNLLEYGAAGQAEDVTALIQKAIDDASENGGGLVRLPAGHYTASTIFLKSNVTLHLDDDAITLKSGTPEIVMENIIIRNCIARSRVCGFKTGPQTFGTIRNVLISDCHFEGASEPPGTQYDPQNGIFLNVSNGGKLEDIIVKNCTTDGFPSSLSVVLSQLNSEYWKSYWPGRGVPAGLGTIRNISFENITGNKLGNLGILIEGRSGSPIENISFSGLNLSTAGRGTKVEEFPEKPHAYPNMFYLHKQIPAYGMYIRHVNNIALKDVNITCQEEDERPEFVKIDVTERD